MEYLEIAGVVIGLVYVWLEYKASIWLWAASIIMPVIYVFVYYDSGFYADMGISIYYFIANIYGWIAWKNKRDDGKPLPITRIPKRLLLPYAAAAVFAFAAIAFILIRFTDSDVPYGDSFTTALSIVGLWMLARKYVEQWIVWIAVDVVCATLYLYKGLYPTAGLYSLYSIIAVAGYFKWLRLMKNEQQVVPDAR